MTLEEKTLTIAFGTATPRQLEFHTATTRYVGYGGARGGGKSHAIRFKGSALAYEYPGIKILIVRKTLQILRDNHIKPLQTAYSRFPATMKPKWNNDEKRFTFPGGSTIKLGYCDSETDVLQYIGQEYDVIFIDESTHLSWFQFININSCVRGVNKFPKRTYCTCNPGEVGHTWNKRIFVDKKYIKKERKKNYTFIQAMVWDNQPLFDEDPEYIEAKSNLGYIPEVLIKALYDCCMLEIDIDKSLSAANNKDGEGVKKNLLMELSGKPEAKHIVDSIKDFKYYSKRCKFNSFLNRVAMEFADYVNNLQNLTKDLKRAWLRGDWNVFAGQYFSEFDTDKHVVGEYEIPPTWRKSLAVDYGLDMLAVLWFATSPTGKTVCYREHAQQNLIVSQAADKIKSLCGSEIIEEYIAPPDLWNRNRDGGRSTASIFAEEGIGIIKPGNSRIDGWLNVKEWLKTMTFFETCTDTINHIQELQYDTKKINDVATQPHDITHLPDALRYWCSRRHLTPDIIETKIRDPFRDMEEHNEEDQLHDFVVGGY